jgi:hypothetical protein
MIIRIFRYLVSLSIWGYNKKFLTNIIEFNLNHFAFYKDTLLFTNNIFINSSPILRHEDMTTKIINFFTFPLNQKVLVNVRKVSSKSL